MEIKVLNLFSEGSTLFLGFEKSGLSIIKIIEKNKAVSDMLGLNRAKKIIRIDEKYKTKNLMYGYVMDIEQIIKEIYENEDRDISILSGRIVDYKSKEYECFNAAIDIIMPKIFIVEAEKEVFEKGIIVDKSKYEIIRKQINMKDYGGFQQVEKKFIIGIKKNLDYKEFKFPAPFSSSDTLENILKRAEESEMRTETLFLAEDREYEVMGQNLIIKSPSLLSVKHPKENRLLNISECAEIVGFEKTWEFCVGNVFNVYGIFLRPIPLEFGEKLGISLKNFLNKEYKKKGENSMSNENELIMKFDINTIKHLGVRLYSTLPPIVAELVANAWDADASDVRIDLKDDNGKEITIEDNGEGMSFSDINDGFLLIGRNRRLKLFDMTTKGRNIIGKKGVGKLAVFGIADEIIVNTVKDGVENEFIMNYKEIEKLEDERTYKPTQTIVNAKVSRKSGTKIILQKLKRKSNFDPETMAYSLSKAFSLFTSKDEEDKKRFYVGIFHNGTEIPVTNELKYTERDFEFTWDFPSDFENFNIDFAKKNNIKGKIFSNKTPLKNDENGIILMARGKLVQNSSFYGNRANDLAHSYICGFLEVDFIDSARSEDYVSTDRNSLTWEHEELQELRVLLNEIINYVASDWKRKRAESKKDEMKEKNIDVDEWIEELPAHEKKLGRKIAGAILENNNLDASKAVNLFQNVKDVFSYESFKEFATQLYELTELSEGQAIKLLEDWQFIEAKEMAKVSEGRIKTIEQFEKYIDENASETKVIQKFLEEFPWLLDPRMNHFEREVTYSKILKEKFKEKKIPKSNKRIDFLCTNQSGVLHIIELKRPKIKITSDEINQAAEYYSFIKSNYPHDVQKIKVFLISNNYNMEDGAKIMAESMENNGKLILKSYSDLLSEAKRYHSKFIEEYKKIEELKKKRTERENTNA